jgi:hypothetical protein
MIVGRYLSELLPLDGKASTDRIREDLGMCLTKGGRTRADTGL